MTAITPISHTQTLDYSQQVEENVWLVQSNRKSSRTVPLPTEQLTAFLTQCEPSAEVICIATPELSDQALSEWCLKMARQGKRVYLLTKSKPKEAASLAGSCLMRFEAPIQGSFVLVNPQSAPRGIYFNGSFSVENLSSPEHLLLEMDVSQSQDAFAFFLYHFWHSATQEIKDSSGKVRACQEAPLSLVKPADQLKKIREIVNSGGLKAACFPSGIWDLSKVRQATLVSDRALPAPEQVGKENNLFANRSPLAFHCVCSEDKGLLLPAGLSTNGAIPFCLELNESQFKHCHGLIREQVQTAEYEFIPSVERGKLANQIIQRLDQTRNIAIVPSSQKEVAVHAPEFLSLKQLENLKPDFSDDGVSCQIRYEWSNHQFALPASAKTDPLYQKWERKQTEFYKRIQDLLTAIEKANSQSTGIADGLKKFIRNMLLGKAQKWQEWQQQLSKLAEKELAASSRTERKKLVEQLNRIQEGIAQSEVELTQMLEEAKHQQQREEEKNKLDIELQQLQTQLAKAQNSIQQKQDAFEQKLAQRKEAFQAFLETQKIKEENWADHKNTLEQQAGKKNQKKHPKEAEAARQALEEAKKYDPKVLIQQQEGDQKKAEKELENLRRKMDSKERERDKLGETFTPSKHSSAGSSIDRLKGKGKQSTTKSFSPFSTDFPENLPAVGELFSEKGKRYLGITYWEEEEEGRREAKRLEADLCFNPEKKISYG